MSKSNPNLAAILFTLQQQHEAMAFGIPQNVCNRNLKLQLGHYWEMKELGEKSQTSPKAKLSLPRSKGAQHITDGRELVVEHAMPRQVIVNMLLAVKEPSERKIRNLLAKYWRVAAVTLSEDKSLTDAGLRAVMPSDWDGVNPWARYEAVGIEILD